VPGILMKQFERSRGTELAGLAVKVMNVSQGAPAWRREPPQGPNLLAALNRLRRLRSGCGEQHREPGDGGARVPHPCPGPRRAEPHRITDLHPHQPTSHRRGPPGRSLLSLRGRRPLSTASGGYTLWMRARAASRAGRRRRACCSPLSGTPARRAPQNY